MRASRWREIFEGALPESRVVTPATRHTPTRSLGGAETGRSAMNGNDGPFACAACKLVFEHQNAAAHSCKQCKLPVHSRGWCAIWCGCQKKASTSVASPASRRSQRRAQRGRPAAPPAGRLACGAPGPGWRLKQNVGRQERTSSRFSVYVALTYIPGGGLLTGFAMRSDPNVAFG